MSKIINNNLFNSDNYNEIKDRILKLQHDAKPNWGIMNASQMMAHVTEVMKNALNENKYPRKLIGYIIAPFWRHKYFNDQPYKIKNLPSYNSFKIASPKDFDEEQRILLTKLKIFHEEGKERTKEACHPLLGKFTPEQWAIGQYKHIDHHLRQFGV